MDYSKTRRLPQRLLRLTGKQPGNPEQKESVNLRTQKRLVSVDTLYFSSTVIFRSSDLLFCQKPISQVESASQADFFRMLDEKIAQVRQPGSVRDNLLTAPRRSTCPYPLLLGCQRYCGIGFGRLERRYVDSLCFLDGVSQRKRRQSGKISLFVVSCLGSFYLPLPCANFDHLLVSF